MEELVRVKPTGGGSFNPLSVYPIGSIYQSVLPTDPSELFGGTWELLKDVFLMAAGDKYPAGSTGGEAQHKLTVDEMPSHKHTLMRPRWYMADNADTTTGSIYALTNGITDHGYTDRGNLKEAGGSQPHNNLPPYLAVYTWVRTA